MCPDGIVCETLLLSFSVQIYFRAEDEKSSMIMPIGLFAAHASEWSVMIAATVIGQCTIACFLNLNPEAIEISPTVVAREEKHIHIPASKDHESVLCHHWFWTI